MSPTYQGYVKNNTTVDIFNGDFVVLQKKTPQIGDVILFKPIGQNKLYLHRIISKIVSHNQTMFLTKGDDNRYTDISNIGKSQFGWIPEENVVGVVIFTVHWVGWFIDEITSFNFLIPFLGIVILLGFIYATTKEELRKKLLSLKLKSNIASTIKFNNRKFSIRKLHSQKLCVIILIGMILFTSFGIEFIDYGSNTVGVNLLQTNGKPFQSSIDLGNPHLFDLETIAYNTQSVYFLNIDMKITSGGLFNSLESVKIQVYNPQGSVNPSNSLLFYKWVTTYHFSGSKIVSGVLIFPENYVPYNQNTSLTINIQYTVSHLFIQDHLSKNMSIIFYS